MSKEKANVEEQVDGQEQVDGTEEVFEGGPTKNQVENWKQQYRDVYLTEFESQTFVWRALNRVEYKELMNSNPKSEWESEEDVVELCVLFPKDYDADTMSNEKAGIPSTIFDQIMSKSGFVSQKTAQKL